VSSSFFKLQKAGVGKKQNVLKSIQQNVNKLNVKTRANSKGLYNLQRAYKWFNSRFLRDTASFRNKIMWLEKKLNAHLLSHKTTTTMKPLIPTGVVGLQRQSLDDYKLALCNDGSHAAYWYQISPLVSPDKIFIYLEGGDICTDKQTCAQRCKETRYLCTTDLRDTMELRGGWWSPNPDLNPAFHDYFKVFVHYCSSDIWNGNKAKSDTTGDLYFMGAEILEAVKDSLTKKFNMLKAKSVVLSGYSAGGIGVWRNCNRFFSGFNSFADVRCLVDSGAFVPWRSFPDDCLTKFNYFVQQLTEFQGHRLDENCLNKDQKYKYIECSSLSTAYTFIDRPLFIAGNQFDTRYAYQFSVVCGIRFTPPLITEWKQGLTNDLQQAGTREAGLAYFYRNCATHETAERYYNDKFMYNGKELTFSSVVNYWMKNICFINPLDRTCNIIQTVSKCDSRNQEG